MGYCRFWVSLQCSDAYLHSRTIRLDRLKRQCFFMDIGSKSLEGTGLSLDVRLSLVEYLGKSSAFFRKTFIFLTRKIQRCSSPFNGIAARQHLEALINVP